MLFEQNESMFLGMWGCSAIARWYCIIKIKRNQGFIQQKYHLVKLTFSFGGGGLDVDLRKISKLLYYIYGRLGQGELALTMEFVHDKGSTHLTYIST